MLAILTLGPAYGSQLLGEFHRRAVHRPSVNVGQAYTTLDRLTKQGLVEPIGKTADGLTLYALTEAGRSAAELWLRHAPTAIGGDDWQEMLDRVLIARSLPNHPHHELVDSYVRSWRQRLAGGTLAADSASPDDKEGTALVSHADALIATAAISWLQHVSDASATGLHYSDTKPRRGRRPHSATPTHQNSPIRGGVNHQTD